MNNSHQQRWAEAETRAADARARALRLVLLCVLCAALLAVLLAGMRAGERSALSPPLVAVRAAEPRAEAPAESSPLADQYQEWVRWVSQPENGRHWVETIMESHPEWRGFRSEQALPSILRRIRGCESGDGTYGSFGPNEPGDYDAYNRQGPGGTPASTASGAFMFLDGTWRAYRGEAGASYARAAHAPKWVQDEAAVRLYTSSGTRPWNASRGCWR